MSDWKISSVTLLALGLTTVQSERLTMYILSAGVERTNWSEKWAEMKDRLRLKSHGNDRRTYNSWWDEMHGIKRKPVFTQIIQAFQKQHCTTIHSTHAQRSSNQNAAASKPATAAIESTSSLRVASHRIFAKVQLNTTRPTCRAQLTTDLHEVTIFVLYYR